MQMLCGLLETAQREASPEAQAVLRSEGLRGRPPDVIGEIEKPFFHYCIRLVGQLLLDFLDRAHAMALSGLEVLPLNPDKIFCSLNVGNPPRPRGICGRAYKRLAHTRMP